MLASRSTSAALALLILSLSANAVSGNLHGEKQSCSRWQEGKWVEVRVQREVFRCKCINGTVEECDFGTRRIQVKHRLQHP